MAKPPKPKPSAKPKHSPKKRTDRRGCPKGKGTVANAGANGHGVIGNPPHEPTKESRQIAETHAAVGTPQWAIAAEMGISEDTLQRHYRDELDRGLIRMNARIGSIIAKKALAGDGDMQKFWMARRGGPAWANKQQTEVTGPEGSALVVRIDGTDAKL